MTTNLKLAKISTKYCDYLRNFDSKVPYNKEQKELRPFVGVLFKISNMEYFAPLSSPKPKHLKMSNSLDFFKIKNGELGAVNFNNMIPVTSLNYEIIEFKNFKVNNRNDRRYLSLLKNQLMWLNYNKEKVYKKSKTLYELYNKGKLDSKFKSRCCNFKLLEEKCIEYNKIILFN